MAALLAGFLQRYAEDRVPRARTVVDLWPGEESPLRELAAQTAATAPPDVVVGVAPWGVGPVREMVDGRARPVVDGAAHLRVLEACLGMARGGAGVFVVGMGFVAKPRRSGVCERLQDFGLHVEAILGLPRGLLYPDSGPGRILVAIRHGPARAPVVARLTRDPASIEEPLSRMP